jgi:hypothetical protein
MMERVGVGKDPIDAQLVRATSANLGTKYIDDTTASKQLSSSTVTTS